MAFLAGCSMLEAERLTSDELAIATKLARGKVLAELKLTDSEKEIVREEQPKISYYILAGTYAQYSFQWKLPDGTVVSVAGTGDVLTLEEATAEFRDY
jgi:hypothetical protein